MKGKSKRSALRVLRGDGELEGAREADGHADLGEGGQAEGLPDRVGLIGVVAEGERRGDEGADRLVGEDADARGRGLEEGMNRGKEGEQQLRGAGKDER